MSNQAPEDEHLKPVVQRIAATAGGLPDVLSADAGCWSEDNATTCTEQGIDAYIATCRLVNGQSLRRKRRPMATDDIV